MAEILNMNNVSKSYFIGGEEQEVLHKINLTVEAGELLSILGPSGSGKSTMMNIIGCLDTATSGQYLLNGINIDELDEIELARVRNREIGFVFQSFQLLPRMTAAENVELPLIYSGVPVSERHKQSSKILQRVGLGDKETHLPTQLSGGQQQRVAIARALITKPSILLADEPTGALDQRTGAQVMELFQEINKEGRTIIMITHDTAIASHGKRVVHILDGFLKEGGINYAH